MSSLPIVLAKRSSLEFLDLHTSHFADHASWHPNDGRETLTAFGLDASSAEVLEGLSLSQPVEVLVPRTAGMRHPAGVSPCGHARPLALDDLIRISDDLYCCVPELAIVETIAPVSAPRAATFIDQMIGSYRILRPGAIDGYAAAYPGAHTHAILDGEGMAAMTMYGLRPLTTLGKLGEFAAKRSYVRGIGRLRESLPLCAEGLRSPLETEDYLLLVCPRRLGGINLPPPLVNEPVTLSERAREVIDRKVLTPDFRWPDQRVVVEVLGAADHAGSLERIADTSKRERVWRTMGFDVLTHTAKEIESLRSFTPLAKELAKRLGMRYRNDIEMFAVRQAWLRVEVSSPAGRSMPSLRSWREMIAGDEYEEWTGEM